MKIYSLLYFMNNLKYLFLIIIFLLFPYFLFASDLSSRLSGQILLQVEENGEAWYVSPETKKRSFLGRPNDAFSIMREQGIGITNKDLLKIPASLDYLSGKDSSGDGLPDAFKVAMGLDVDSIDTDGDGFSDYEEILQGYNPLGPGKLPIDENFSQKQAGKILLQVERNGEAWYVSPDNNKRYFLGRPTDAFSIMRNLGLGISNQDLEKIEKNIVKENVQVFNWHYNQKDYTLEYSFDSQVFDDYNQEEKLLYYLENEKPDDIREAYYEIFFDIKESDNDTLAVLDLLLNLASQEGYENDEKIEFILAFIQYIPYDYDKAKRENPKANFPFETLYLNSGVCTDTSFLSILWLESLGYSTAILDFPESNHAALGIKCPDDLSLNQSGYCYVETTNYFPFGVVPSSLDSGQAQVADSLTTNPFSSDNLGNMEIRLENEGKSYEKMDTIIMKVDNLQDLREEIENYKLILENDPENSQEIVKKHNDLVDEYNQELKLFFHY